MEIIIAKTAGFCFGVNNAVNKTFELLNDSRNNIYTIGEIIHNRQVIEDLKLKGVKVVEDVKKINTPANVVIRAHGVAPQILNNLNDDKIKISDATCPYVKKIHNLVKEKYDEGFQIVIIGDKNHPEVVGINGWCENTAYILSTEKEVDLIPNTEKKLCIVAQTTITYEKWETINKYLQKKFANIIKFDTICSATSKRQTEANEISKQVDLMLVVGGINSSNTQKLFEICKKNCPATYKIETYGDIPPLDLNNIKKIGITAGASTPDWVIKEVISKMDAMENKQETEISFKDAFENSLVVLKTGEIVKGKVIGFNNTEVFVDLGYKSDGIIPMDEFIDDPDFDPQEEFKAGDEIEVFVVKVNDGDGNVLLSKRKVDSIRNLTKIEEAFNSKTPVKAKVLEVVKGGVIANYKGVRIFVPASQISDRFVKDLKEFLNKEIEVLITEYNKQKRKVVGSRKVLVEEEKAKKLKEFWSNIEAGKVYKGIVKSLMDFGAFVDIGGVDGLVHISELSWNKIKHPSEVLKVGDTVEVNVLEFYQSKNRISLGYKKIDDNPWYKADEKYKVGEVVKGQVVRIVPFGVFVKLEEGVDGLVHISQISNVRLAKADEVLKIGQEVEMKVLEINTELKKISLSIKEVAPIDPVREETAESSDSNNNEPEEKIPSEHKEDMTNTIGDTLKDLNVE